LKGEDIGNPEFYCAVIAVYSPIRLIIGENPKGFVDERSCV